MKVIIPSTFHAPTCAQAIIPNIGRPLYLTLNIHLPDSTPHAARLKGEIVTGIRVRGIVTFTRVVETWGYLGIEGAVKRPREGANHVLASKEGTQARV